MLKWIGAGIILAAGTAYGFAQASRYARRPKELRQLSAALTMLESEIVYGISPLAAALSRIARAAPKPVAFLFEEAAGRMEEEGAERTAAACWSEAVHAVWPQLALREPEKAALLALAPMIGITDRDDQAKHLRLAVGQIQAEEASARDEHARYGKMWKSLGPLAAALIVILMY